MTENIFYKEDFYSLKQRVEEDEVNSLLNNDAELADLIKPSAALIKEHIYHQLAGTIKSALPIPENEPEINQSLRTLLAEIRFFDKLEEKAASALFSFAFEELWQKIASKQSVGNVQYTIQTNVLYWLEYQVAEAIVSDERFSSLQTLTALIYDIQISHQFYRYLVNNIPIEWITIAKDEWTSVSGTIEDLTEGLRTFDRDYLQSYKSIDASNLSSWKYIEQSARYADYVMLNEQYSFKSAVLLEHDIALWVKLWDNFKTLIMQDAALSLPRFYIDDFMSIAEQLAIQKSFSTPLPHLILLLVKNLFETSQRISQRMSFYRDGAAHAAHLTQNDKKIEELIADGRKAGLLWESKKKDVYIKIFEILKPIADRKVFDEFIFSQKHRSQPNNSNSAIYNEEIDLLTNSYKKIFVNNAELKLAEIQEHFNFEKFNFYLSSLQEKESISEDIIKELLGQLLLFTDTQEYFWDGSFNPPFWDVMKGISYLLSKYTNPVEEAEKLINDVKVTQEGWNLSKKQFQFQVRECFFYCGIALLMEHENAFKNSEKENYYKKIVQLIINQCRYSIYDHGDYYVKPLMVCYWVVCQCYLELKPYFEKEVVTLLDDLYTILAVLSATEDKMEPDTKVQLEQRIEKELPFEKRKLKRNNLRDRISFFESTVKRLGLKS